MSRITKSAEMEECLVRIHGACNFRPETTVFAHLGGAGMGIKQPDYAGSYCCSTCHDVIDGRIQTSHSHQQLKLWHLQGVIRTQAVLVDKGLLKIA